MSLKEFISGLIAFFVILVAVPVAMGFWYPLIVYSFRYWFP